VTATNQDYVIVVFAAIGVTCDGRQKLYSLVLLYLFPKTDTIFKIIGVTCEGK